MWTSEKVFSYVHVDTGKDLFLCPDEKVIFLYVKVKKDWNFPLIILLVSFPFQYGNELFLIWKELGMGFFLYEWRSHEYRKNNFPMNGLAGIVKENFPMSGEAANGETFFYYDC